MKRIAFLFTAFFLLTLTFSAVAQPPKKPKVMAARRVEADKKIKNPNIKTEAPPTDAEVAKPSIVRGSCTVSFSNSTGYYVKVYVDGNYKGTLAPWESGSVTVYSGYTTVYCITTGGTYDWSAQGDCSGTYVFDIR
jgi:hypothetical protein